MQHTTSLDAFDLLELLLMLSGQGKTGLMQVEPTGAGAAPFLLWLAAGRVQAVTYGPLRGAAALARMLGAPQGQFVFEPGLRVPAPDLDVSLDDLTWQALDAVALPAPDFSGPGRLTALERVAALACSPEERMVLRRLEAQEPVGEVAGDPLGARVVAKLVRLGLLAPRRTRVARLTLGVTRQVRGAAVLDAVHAEVVSDVGAGVFLLRGALDAAALTVRINLRPLPAPDRTDWDAALSTLETEAQAVSETVRAGCAARLVAPLEH